MPAAAIGVGMGLIGLASGAGKNNFKPGSPGNAPHFTENAFNYGDNGQSKTGQDVIDSANGAQRAAQQYQNQGDQASIMANLRGAQNKGMMNTAASGLNAQGQALGNRAAPTMDNRQYDRLGMLGNADRGNQTQALNLMRGAANGMAPSVAQLQQQQGIDAAVRSQQAMAASARGPAALAMANSNAAANTAALQQQGIAQNAQLRAQEMAQARGDFAGMASTMRSSDLSAQQLAAQDAQSAAQLQMATRAQNEQAQLQFQQLGLQAQGMGMQNEMANAQFGGAQDLAYQQMGQRVNEDQLNANMAREHLFVGGQQANDAMMAGVAQHNADWTSSMFNGIVGSMEGGMQGAAATGGLGGGGGAGGYPSSGGGGMAGGGVDNFGVPTNVPHSSQNPYG